MSDIWNGTMGPKHYLCVHCSTIWNDWDFYMNHVAAEHGPTAPQDAPPLRVISVDDGVVTLRTAEEGSTDESDG